MCPYFLFYFIYFLFLNFIILMAAPCICILYIISDNLLLDS